MHLNTTWSIIYAHNGLFAIEARYFFSHIIYIASTLASISGRSSSPLLLGSVVSFQFISGFLPSHIKDFIWLVILWTTSLGISFAVVRYIALDWIKAFRTSSFPLVNRFILAQLLSTLFCVLRIPAHCILVLFSFPTYAPSIYRDSLSFTILIKSSILSLMSPFDILISIIWSLYFFVAIGRTSDFSSLNLAVDASQKLLTT